MIWKDRTPTGVTKRCTKCNHTLDTAMFNRLRYGLDSWCRECKRIDAKAHYWKNPEKHRAKARERAKDQKGNIQARKLSDPAKYLWICAKSRANKQGIVFDMEVTDIVVPNNCPVLKIPLYFSEGCATDNSPTIDRLIPRKGYVRGNIAVISKRANRIKGDATTSELLAIATWCAERGQP